MKYIKTYEAIVYHGSPNEFETFNTEHIGKTSNREFFGNGIYFSIDKTEANKHGKYIYKVEIPDRKYFLNFDVSFEEQSQYIQKCLNKIDISTKDKMLLVIFDALQFRAARMLFPYKSGWDRKYVEVDFAKIAKTFKWDV